MSVPLALEEDIEAGQPVEGTGGGRCERRIDHRDGGGEGGSEACGTAGQLRFA
jgi:hypothetical protein